MTRLFDSLEELIVDCGVGIRPPERLTIPEAAEKYRYLHNVGSYVGPWRNDITPYLIEPCEVVTSKEFSAVIFAGPAQCGKTEILLNGIVHGVVCDPADTMLVGISHSAAKDFSTRRIKRLIAHSPAVRARLIGGRNSQNLFDAKFVSGMYLTLSWPAINELSGKPIPRVYMTDYDRMPENIDGEGEPFALARKRTTTFGRHAMTIAESSPGYTVDNPQWLRKTPHEAPPTKGILSLYNRGDRRRWYWPCPHCNTPFEPAFELLRYEKNSDHLTMGESAEMECPTCHALIPHDEGGETPGKRELNKRGRWVKDGQTWNADGTITGEPFRSDIASFWLPGVAAAFADWKTLVINYEKGVEDLAATGSEEALKTTVNTDQGMPYVLQGMMGTLSSDFVKKRAQIWPEGTVPEGVRFLLATIDVQTRSFKVMVTGFGENQDAWIIDYYTLRKSERFDEEGERLPLNPGSYLEDWNILIDGVLQREYPMALHPEARMGILRAGCDSGGREGVTDTAYKFWLKCQRDSELREKYGSGLHKRFRLLRGTGNPMAPRTKLHYPDTDRKNRHASARGEIPILFIQTNMLKDAVAKRLGKEDDTPGMRLITRAGSPDKLYEEMTAEIRDQKGKWDNPRRKRNEALDLTCYALAMALHAPISIEKLNWDKPPAWAAPIHQNEMVRWVEADEEADGLAGNHISIAKPQEKRHSLKQLAKKLG